MQQPRRDEATSTKDRGDGPRYTVLEAFAEGGMASIHLGRQEGSRGFERPVAIKRLHGKLANDARFVAMFVDEARVASRIRHMNVVPTLDVVEAGAEVLQVMELVEGESLAWLCRVARHSAMPMPVGVCVAILCGVLHGLHAAHEASAEDGTPLDLVHLDVSPQNVLVGADGVARIIDFGLAKARGYVRERSSGIGEGKLSYMAPEQLGSSELSRATDVYGAGVMLWEMLGNRRLRAGGTPERLAAEILLANVPPPSVGAAGPIDAALEEVVRRATAHNPSDRYASALEMADALEQASRPASQQAVGRHVRDTPSPKTANLHRILRTMESGEELEREGSRVLETEGPGSVDEITTNVVSEPEPSLIELSRADSDVQIETAAAAPTAPGAPVLSGAPAAGAGPTPRAGREPTPRDLPARVDEQHRSMSSRRIMRIPDVRAEERRVDEALAAEATTSPTIRAPAPTPAEPPQPARAITNMAFAAPLALAAIDDEPPPTKRGFVAVHVAPHSDPSPISFELLRAPPRPVVALEEAAPIPLVTPLPPAVAYSRAPSSLAALRRGMSTGRVGAVAGGVIAALALAVMLRGRADLAAGAGAGAPAAAAAAAASAPVPAPPLQPEVSEPPGAEQPSTSTDEPSLSSSTTTSEPASASASSVAAPTPTPTPTSTNAPGAPGERSTSNAPSATAVPSALRPSAPSPRLRPAGTPAAGPASPAKDNPCDPPVIVRPDGTRAMRPGCS